MQERIIDLTWYGPFLWFGKDDASVFQFSQASRPGIYLWTVPHQDGHLIYYVGETGKSFTERLTAHAKEYLSGTYRIYEPNKFALGEKELIWPDTWMQGTQRLIPEFMARYEELAPLLQEFLLKMRIFLGPIETDARTRKRIEAEIAKTTTHLAVRTNKFQETEIRYARRTPDENPVTVRMKSTVRILDLPSIITA